MPTTGRRRPLWRATDPRHEQPWWYASRNDNPTAGRFDLAHPRGTCYWAVSAAAAIIEATTDPDQRDAPVLSVRALTGVTVWRAAEVPAARSKLADTTVASVPTLTGELATILPFDVPWAWADAFDAVGCRGLLYRARFAMDESVAMFGDAGVPPAPPSAIRSTGADHYAALPPGFRSGGGTVGTFKRLETAPPP